MIDVFDLYERFSGRVNTHQGGHARPHRNFLNWVRDINKELFREYYQVFEKTQEISDVLTPFLRSQNVVILPNPGANFDIIRKPTDYSRFAQIRVFKRGGVAVGLPGLPTCNCQGEVTECPVTLDPDELVALRDQADMNLEEVAATKVDNTRWGALASRISKKATADSPMVTAYEGGVKIRPKGLGVVVFDYFRAPLEPSFIYTIQDQGLESERIQYDAVKSTKLEWDDTLTEEFLSRLQGRYAMYVRNQAIAGMGQGDRVEAK